MAHFGCGHVYLISYSFQQHVLCIQHSNDCRIITRQPNSIKYTTHVYVKKERRWNDKIESHKNFPKECATARALCNAYLRVDIKKATSS